VRFQKGVRLLKDLAPLAELANYLIKIVDPTMHDHMARLREVMTNERPEVACLCSQDPGLHLTVGLVVNRQSGSHTDSGDAMDSWAVMFSFGEFKGGDLEFEDYGIRTRFQPGDAIVLRARELRHGIRPWEGSLRTTVVYFSNESVWKEFGFSPLS
jgi:hypothetical protein